MILDELMPKYDVVERHETVVRAPATAVFAAVRSADLASGFVPKLLLTLRALPAALLSPSAGLGEIKRRWRRADGQRLRLADFEQQGFRVVAEHAPSELVIGLLGQFWTTRPSVCADVSVETFASGPTTGLALAGWNFTAIAGDERTCELRTETRVLCAPDARRAFLLYWFLIRPGSGLIRRAMLSAIKCEAETSERDGANAFALPIESGRA
ncbi:MAG: hypothetical protein ABI969_01625 [bacterium]